MQLKTILHATDFSDASQAAFDQAMLEAWLELEPKVETYRKRGWNSAIGASGTALAIMTGYSAEFPVNPRGEELDRVPSLILWGEKDAWVKPAVADRLQAALPSARRVTIEGAGHAPMETHPEQTRAAVLALFRDAPAIASAR